MRRLLLVVLLPVVALALAGCSVTPSSPNEFALVQYPNAGFQGFYSQTAAAKKSIDMELYELNDVTEVRALEAAAQRGVVVRVLLDQKYEVKAKNQPAFDELASHGVQVRWADADTIFHAKVTTFDGTTSDISTANLTSQYYAATRDAEIVDTYPVHVKAIEQTFVNDWNGGDPATDEAGAPGLIWSPDAESTMVDFIASAKTRVDFMSEELSDPYIYGALAADAARGVRCRIVMTDSPNWDTGFATAKQSGCAVHVVPDTPTGFYVHEKLIVTDGQRMMLGSQNASYSSLAFNRELSIVLTKSQAPDILKQAETTFGADFARAHPWSG
jgi:phosphatidylserine/phosphatidylglycerophosphate/cardiolipin synthase-like enzyme